MDDFDRERSSGKASDPYARRRPTSDERDADIAPVEPSRYQRLRPGEAAPDDYVPERTTRERSSAAADQPERYSDRFRRTDRTQSQSDDSVDRSYQSTRDPYDRLRRVSSRPPRRVEVDPDIDALGYLDDDYDERVPVVPVRSKVARSRTQSKDEPSRMRTVGSSLAHPVPELRPLMVGGIIALGSLLLLSVLILVRSGSAPAWIPMHLDAEGTPTVYGTTTAIWRLPLFAFMTTLMALGLGWWLRAREAFATQYLIVGALLVHGFIWVGTITLLW